MLGLYNYAFGTLILRLAVGFLMILHGYAKYNFGISFIESTIVSHNLPSQLAYGIYVGEILAPLLLIIGYKTKFAASLIIITMIMAIYLVHPNELISLTKSGGLVLELQYLFILSSFAILFLGPGKFSIDKN